MKPPPLSTSMISASLSSVIFTLLTFVSGVVLARCLGEEGRGQYGAAYFWAQFAISMGSLSFFEAAIVRRDAEVPAQSYLSSIFAASILLVIATMGVFALAVGAGLVKVPGVAPAVLVLFVGGCAAVSLMSRSMSTIENMRHNFKLLNYERVFSPLMFVVFSIVAALLFGGDIHNIMIAFLLSVLPLFLLRLYRFRKALFLPLDLTFTGSVLRLGSKFHIAAALTLVATQLDRLVLVSAWSPERLGHYFVALSVAGAGLSVVSQALGLTLLPMLSAVHPSVRRDRVERLFRYTIVTTVLFVAVIWLASPLVIPLVFGAAFAPAVLYAQGLGVAMAPLPLRSIVLETNRSAQRDRPGMEMAVASLVIFLAVFALTRFRNVSDLFWAVGLSNLGAVAVGLRQPIAAGDFRLASAIVPAKGDLGYLASQLFGYLRGLAVRAGGRP